MIKNILSLRLASRDMRELFWVFFCLETLKFILVSSCICISISSGGTQLDLHILIWHQLASYYPQKWGGSLLFKSQKKQKKKKKKKKNKEGTCSQRTFIALNVCQRPSNSNDCQLPTIQIWSCSFSYPGILFFLTYGVCHVTHITNSVVFES